MGGGRAHQAQQCFLATQGSTELVREEKERRKVAKSLCWISGKGMGKGRARTLRKIRPVFENFSRLQATGSSPVI